MKKVLFIDRDGTLILEPADEQIDSFYKLKFYPGALVNLARIAREMDYELVMVTNQDGLGTESFPESSFWPVQHFVLETFKNEGVVFADVLIDRSFPHENKDTRKPGTGMLTKYLHGKYDMANSYVIGDRVTDIQLAKNLGAKSIFIGEMNADADFSSQKWEEIYQHLKNSYRKVNAERKTKETNIAVELNLQGSGKAEISTGIGFFDHMLEQIARHGQIDLTVKAENDLHVDEHHGIEDVGITLGKAFALALADKRGIERYGFALPMDDAKAEVLIDFGGRPFFMWKAKFKREKIGEMPTEMFPHFFRSFSDEARCNLQIKAKGKNEHHKIEAIFKAFAKAVKMAVSQNQNFVVPSTKGSL